VSLSIAKGGSIAGVFIFLLTGLLLGYLANQRERARRQAHAARKTTEEFMSIASHELRAPLAGARMGVDLAQRQVRDVLGANNIYPEVTGVDETLDTLNGVRRQLDRQERLVTDLLDVARIQTSGLALNMRPADVVALVVEAVQELHYVEPTRTVTVQIPERPLDPVLADSGRLRQVVINYLANAFKYSSPGTPVHVRVALDGAYARVEVQDEGPGLSADQHQRIWERYQRATGTPPLSDGDTGLGLGLYISRDIVERHGGSVGLESTPGQGATFWFMVPIDAPKRHRLFDQEDSVAG
jgi:signal transduction histidine kinase